MRRVGEDGPPASLPLSDGVFFLSPWICQRTLERQRSLGIHGTAALGGVGSTGEVVAAGFPLTSGPPITGMATHHPSLSRRNAGPGQIQVISGVSVCRHLLPVIPQRLHIPSVHDVPVHGSPTVPLHGLPVKYDGGIARHTKLGETSCFFLSSKQPCPRAIQNGSGEATWDPQAEDRKRGQWRRLDSFPYHPTPTPANQPHRDGQLEGGWGWREGTVLSRA